MMYSGFMLLAGLNFFLCILVRTLSGPSELCYFFMACAVLYHIGAGICFTLEKLLGTNGNDDGE